MAATERRQNASPPGGNAQGTRLRRLVQDFARYDNDNRQPGSLEDLLQSKRRTWQMFARWLMLGGLLFGLILVAVLAFVYSGYP
jgi:hypothetical protein